MEAVGSYDELLAKPGVRGTEVWARGEGEESRAAGRPAGPQAVHRRGDVRFAVREGRADAARAGSDRLLVRLRRDAVRAVGIPRESPSAPSPPRGGSRGEARGERQLRKIHDSSPPTSSAKRSTKPAAGSTANWRSARCCLARSEERRSEEREQRHSLLAPRSSLPTPTPSATASSSA